ncbi:M23 family metallopeptidase [Candidatus Poribacteria bacterium]|nr:M23 family metallopeptidase [Candidatus Poribacteria bacterium]
MRDDSTSKQHQNRHRWVLFLIIAVVLGFGFYLGPILLESTPPTLELSGVEGGKTYRGHLTVNISASDERPGLGSLTVQIDGDSPQPLEVVAAKHGEITWTLDTALLADGAHHVLVTATDKSLRKNTTQQQLKFVVDNTPPQLQIPPESRRAGQGRTLAIFAQTDEPVSVLTGEIFNRQISFHSVNSTTLYRSLIGIGVTHATKEYPLTLKATDLIGNTTQQTFPIEIVKTVFKRGGYIVLSPAKKKIMMDKSKSREDNAKRGIAYAKANKESMQLWEGKFIRATEGRLTSPFGKYREYNTGVRRHHLGTDIANDTGTPIYASNHGIVTLAERLHIYGNAIVISHGQGVSTSYNHLSEIRVQIGDRVQKGKLIGLMGATGQVTGPHLHWGMVINGVAVAPEEWTERDFSGLEK